MKASQSAIERVQQLNFDKEEALMMTTAEALPLMQEHLRRLSLWMDYLQIDASRWGGLLIENLSQYVSEEISLDEEDVAVLKNARTLGFYTKLTLRHYLLWSCLEDHPTIINSKLPNPYDPLLDIYDGGVYFARENIVIFLSARDGEQIFSLDRDKYR